MLQGIVTVILCFAFAAVIAHNSKKQEEKFRESKRRGRPVLRRPRLLMVLVLFLTSLFIALGVLLAVSLKESERLAGLVFLPPVLAGLCLVFAQMNWRLVLEPDGFVFFNSLRRKRLYTYRDIQSVTLRVNGMKAAMPDCRICISSQVAGVDLLLYRADLAGAEIYDHRSQQQLIPVRAQLAALAALGVSPNSRALLDSICEEFQYDMFQKEPYAALLSGMGFYGGKGSNPQPVSNQVFSLDLQCITQNESYALLMRQFYRMASGECTMADMVSRIDPATSRALISFQWNGQTVQWSLPQEARLFNRGLLVGLNRLLEKAGSEKRFCSVVLGMRLTVVFIRNQDIWELNRLTGLKFSAEM